MASDEHRADALVKAVIGRVRVIDATTGLVVLCAAALAYLTVEVWLDHAFVLQKQVRIPLWTLLKWGVGTAFVLFVIWPMVRRIGPMFAAKRIEDAVPGANNELITYLDIRDDSSVDRSIVRAVSRRAAQLSANVRTDRVVDGACVLRACSGLAIVVAVLAIYSLVSPKSVLTSLKRAVRPGEAIAPPSRTQIVAVLPGDQNVPAGSVTDVQAHVKGRHPESVDLWWSAGGQRWKALVLTEGEKGCWAGRLQVTGRQVDYYIAAGDTKSDRHKLTAVHEPAVVQVAALLDLPDYTGLDDRETKDGNIQTLVGTKATIRVSFNNPVQEAMLVFESGAKLRCALVEDRTAKAQIRITDDDTYWVSCSDRYGGSNRNPVKYKITALPDKPPTLVLRSPECDLALAQNAELLVDFEASDDYGLASAKFVYANDKGGGGAVPIDIEPGAQQVELQIAVPVSTIGVAGDKVTYHLQVEDALQPVGQRAKSESRRLDILAPERGPQVAAAQQPGEREDAPEDKPEDEDRQESAQDDGQQEGDQELLAKEPVRELQEVIERDQDEIETIIEYLDEQDQAPGDPQEQEDEPAEGGQEAGEQAQRNEPVDEQGVQQDGADGQQQQDDLQAEDAGREPAGDERAPGEQGQQPGEADGEGHDDSGRGQDAGQGEQGHREGDSAPGEAQEPRPADEQDQARDNEAAAQGEDGQGQPGENAEGAQDGQGERGQGGEQQAGGEQGQGGQGEQGEAGQGQADQNQGGQGESGQSQGGQSQDGQGESGQSQGGQSQGGQGESGQSQGGQSQGGQGESGQSQGGQSQGEQGESGQSQGGQSQGGQGESGQSQGGQSQGGQGESGQSQGGQSQGGQGESGQSQGGQSQGGQGESGQSQGGQSQGGQGESGQSQGGQSQGGQGESGQSQGGQSQGGQGESGQSQGGQNSGGQSAGGGQAGQRERGMADQGHSARGLESVRTGKGRPMDVSEVRGMVERLAGPLQKGEVAPELLERLDWEGDDMHNFIKKYKRHLKAVRSAEEKAEAERDALEPGKGRPDERKRTLRIVKGAGLDKTVRSQDGKPDQPTQKDEIRDLFEAKKDTVSIEYRDLVEAYYKSLAGAE